MCRRHQEGVDAGLQVLHAAKSPTADRLLAQCVKPPLHQVLINRRASSERSELVRAPEVRVRPIPYGQTGRLCMIRLEEGDGYWVLLLHNKGCALRDAPRSKLGCRAEPRHL